MGWLKEMFWPSPTPSELYKRKEAIEFAEAVRRSAIITYAGGRMENLGLSEYGAQKLLEEGKEPACWEKVLLQNGGLVTWQEWKEMNQ